MLQEGLERGTGLLYSKSARAVQLQSWPWPLSTGLTNTLVQRVQRGSCLQLVSWDLEGR